MLADGSHVESALLLPGRSIRVLKRATDASPEKAGVGGSIPSLATISKSIT